jgi:hypothetical protein
MDEQRTLTRTRLPLTDEEILSVYRKCFPRGLPVRDDDIIYLALALLKQQ